MKLAKTIIICVLSCLLTLSVALNIFTYTIFEIHDVESFKQVLFSKELLDSFTSIGNGSEDTSEDIIIDSSNNNSEPDQTLDQQEPEEDTNKLIKGDIIFDEGNILITFVEQSEGLLGPSFKFCVENKTNKSINVSFTDLYIDGFMAEVSGGSIQQLESGKKAFIDVTIWEMEYEDFTNEPEQVEYIIRIWDPETWADIIVSDKQVIYLK